MAFMQLCAHKCSNIIIKGYNKSLRCHSGRWLKVVEQLHAKRILFFFYHQELLQECGKPKEVQCVSSLLLFLVCCCCYSSVCNKSNVCSSAQDFINGLLYRMKGLRKMSGPLKK